MVAVLTVEEKNDITDWGFSWCQSRIVQSALQLRNASDKNGDHCKRYTGPWVTKNERLNEIELCNEIKQVVGKTRSVNLKFEVKLSLK